jgi:hypothetical protein
MDPRIAPLTEILRLNTRLFRNCLESVTDEMAAMRPSASTRETVSTTGRDSARVDHGLSRASRPAC